MPDSQAQVTYIGGPTALLEFGGLRFLTDPTLDPAGTSYPTPAYTLRKTQSPAVPPAALGRVDAVLLSHDHHFDNLDHQGREALRAAPAVYTTRAGANRLGTGVGMDPWDEVVLPGAGPIHLIATPARHGPAGGDRGPVIGFLLSCPTVSRWSVYVSGDTVWYEEVARIGRRFDVGLALLNLGAARVAAAGPHPLTFTATEAVELALAWPAAAVVPLHFEGWEHFSEGRAEVAAAFDRAGLASRLCWLEPGVATGIPAGPFPGP